jgi:hypothetical protein
MFRPLITECRSVLEDAETHPQPEGGKPQPEGEYKAVRLNKHDRAAHKIGYLLSTPLPDMSRKKMLKLVPHMHHHFEKGHGKGEGDYGVVDVGDLAALGRHAQEISNHANAVMRMPGPAHHLASHLTGHVANIHDRMSKFGRDNSDDESAELHANESGKFRHLSHHHRKIARRHGYFESGY